jgi:hypothetical protein
LAAELGFERRMKLKHALVVLAALTVASPALAQAPPSAPTPKCDVTVQSRTGGAMEIAPAQAKGATGPQLVWQPVASGPGIQLFVIYPAEGLTRMDEPNGVLIRFRTQSNRGTDMLSVVVTTRGGRAWRFDPPTVVSDSSESAHVAFGLDWPYGRGMLSAIADNQPLTVSVEQDGQTLASDSFALSNIGARDALLAQARGKFQALDAAVCAVRSAAP